jgi:hypothetical protein
MTENLNHKSTPENESSQNPFDAFLKHQQKAIEEGAKAIDALLPEGFKSHGKEAGREFIKGFKVLVDAAVTELEKASRDFDRNMRRSADETATSTGDSDRPTTTGPNKVKVVVD